MPCKKFWNTEPYFPYNVVIYAVNPNGNGVPTVQLFFSSESSKSRCANVDMCHIWPLQFPNSCAKAPSKAPENVRVLRIDDVTINVTWDLMSLTEARGNITHYDIAYKVNTFLHKAISTNKRKSTNSLFLCIPCDLQDATTRRKREDMIVIAEPNKGYATIRNLVRGTRYAAKVRAVTTAGEGSYSPLTY